jgi:hypothetical protein
MGIQALGTSTVQDAMKEAEEAKSGMSYDKEEFKSRACM